MYKNIYPTDKCLQKKYYISLVESHWVYKLDLRAVHVNVQKQMVNTKRTKWWFWKIFCLLLFCCFVYLLSKILLVFICILCFIFNLFFISFAVCVCCAFWVVLALFLFLYLFSKEREKDGLQSDGWRGAEYLWGDKGEKTENIIYWVSFE